MHKFDDLKNHIENNLNIDTSKGKSHFKPIKEIFRTGADVDKRVDPGPDGLYYTDENGKKHKGFLFIEGGYNRDYAIMYNKKTIVPKFHISKCTTIEQQKRNKNYDGHYAFSQEKETMVDLDGIEKELYLCKNCLNMQSIIKKVLSVSEYVEKYIKNPKQDGNFDDSDLPSSKKSNIFQENGYTPDWDQKSHEYRLSIRFTCEECGIRLNENYIDGYYLETHHKDKNKSNNSPTNLKGLCTLCHANIDDLHKKNYSSGRNKQKLDTFVEIFKDKLRDVNNKYLDNFLDGK